MRLNQYQHFGPRLSRERTVFEVLLERAVRGVITLLRHFCMLKQAQGEADTLYGPTSKSQHERKQVKRQTEAESRVSN